ncbi:MAG: response regulator [Oscillospiraceae bacterium]|jgi:signal transduction histidine kinase/DNA-binding LytR/AlgR family response regulator/HPt (histidine-containing phosphotransfer) domain-containing protein|nr:response regulator [Oscillospiraceae bacterium]
MSVIRIAMCDDDKMALETYASICSRICSKHGIDAEIKKYESGNDLMFDFDEPKFQNTLDLLFLDISMPGPSGIDIAREARELGFTGIIIFITGSEESYREAFDVGAFHYITKGESVQRFEEILLKAVESSRNSDRKEIVLSGWGEIKKLKISSIEYFEIINRIITVHYDNEEFEFQGSFQKLEEQLADKGFLRIHRNYLVSLSYIKSMTYNEAVMISGKTLPVGRKHHDGLKAAFGNVKFFLSIVLMLLSLLCPLISAFAWGDVSGGYGDLIDVGHLMIATTNNGTLSVDRLLYVASKKISYHIDFTCPVIIEGYNMANIGACDGVIAGKPDLEREYENLIKVPVPLEDINVFVFARKGSELSINSWDDLSGLNVGILANRTYILDRLPRSVSISIKDTNRGVFDGLVKGEYDAAVLIERSHETLGEGADVIRVGKVDKLTEYLYLNKERESLVAGLQSALKSMFDDGSADRILWDIPMPEINAKKTIVHIVSNNVESEREKLFREALNQRFEDDVAIELKTINLEIEHLPRDQHKLTYVANLLRADCVSRNISAIVVSGEPAFDFLMDYYYLYFRNVPILFYGVGDRYLETMGNNERFTGIVDTIDAYQTVKAALSIFPNTKSLYVVNDYTANGQRYRRAVETQLKQLGGDVYIEYNENTDCASLMNKIDGLPRDSLVLFGSYFTDVAGQSFTLSEMGQLLKKNCTVPILSLYCTNLAYNSIGGKVPDYRQYGETIADMLQSLLSGAEPADIPAVYDSSSYNVWVFDKNMLDRFNIGSSALPAGASIINQPLSLWKTNPQFVIVTVFLVLVCVLIIIIVSRFALSRSRHLAKIVSLRGELEDALKKTQEVNDAKSKFIANVSHEMRTPLNAVVGLSALSLDIDELNKDAVINLEKIYNSGMTLLSIVNDILDISKIEAGKFEIVEDEYDTPSLINDVISQNILSIGEKPISFLLNLDEDMPARLCGDVLRIKQIFNNLLSNAFKYTMEGTVKLSIKCYRENSDVWLIIQTQDTGVGIREEDLPRILSDYFQVNMESNRVSKGTGLGLPITKMLVEMMGGTMNVVSEYGKGSAFTVRFKQGSVTEAAIETSVVNNLKNLNYSNGKRKQNVKLARAQIPYAKVLIVDDVITNLDVMKGLVKPYKAQTDCVTSGRQAIDLIREEKVRYNAIFMDHMMPDIDGIEATRLIRGIGTEYAKNIPIIAFTANAIVGNEQMFLDAGFQDFISKPIDLNRLDMIINRWVKDKSAEATDEHQAARPATTGKTGQMRDISDWRIEGLDIAECIEHFGGDEELFQIVLKSFVLNTPPLIEKARNPDKDDLDKYTIAIHSIKGSCRTIVAHSLAKKAEALEKAAKAIDMAYVCAHNAAFLEEVEAFLAQLCEL